MKIIDRWQSDSPSNLNEESRSQGADFPQRDYETRVWVLRVFCRLAQPSAYSRRSRLSDLIEDVLEPLGLDFEYEGEPVPERDALGLKSDKPELKLLARSLRKTLKQDEARLARAGNSELSRNIARLGKILSLSESEKTLLRFFTQMSISEYLQEICDKRIVGSMNGKKLPRCLAAILDLPQRDIAKSLSNNAPLLKSGIIEVCGMGRRRRFAEFELKDLEVTAHLATALLDQHNSEQDFLAALFRRSPAATLTKNDFPHAEKEFALARDYLEAARKSDSRGVNILIYGKPGTGKTEMARAVCDELGLNLYETPIEDEDDDPMKGDERIRSCLLAQCLLARRGDTVLLFDEIEDVFPESFRGPALFFFGGLQGAKDNGKKAWTNHLLENNPIPTFWISNKAGQIDPAFIRRFDVVLRLHPPGPKVRRRMLDAMLDGVEVSETWLDRMATNRDLTPAHIARGAKVVKALTESEKPKKRGKRSAKASQTTGHAVLSKATPESVLETLFTNTLEAQGRRLNPMAPAPMLTLYDPDLLNADADLSALAQGIAANPKGRLCFYGPPGTGKTAFAHHLASCMGNPIIVRQMADLLSCWVGETEQNIAAMFHEAKRERAVLLLDEADGLLGERGGASHSWEITQTNQVLTSMENFDSVFIASTNLMKHLDQASLRRFDFKIAFSYLKPAQTEKMFRQTLKKQGLKVSAKEADSAQQRLRRIDNLTPGDFNTVLRKQRLLGGFSTARQLLIALEQEAKLKPGANKTIGFVS